MANFRPLLAAAAASLLVISGLGAGAASGDTASSGPTLRPASGTVLAVGPAGDKAPVIDESTRSPAGGITAGNSPGRSAAGPVTGSRFAPTVGGGTVSVVSQRHAGYLWSTSAAGGPVSTFYSFNTTGGTEAVNHPAGGE